MITPAVAVSYRPNWDKPSGSGSRDVQSEEQSGSEADEFSHAPEPAGQWNRMPDCPRVRLPIRHQRCFRRGFGSGQLDQIRQRTNVSFPSWCHRAHWQRVSGIVATMPIPMPWPEQDVKKVDEQVSRHVRSVQSRVLDGGVRQLVVTIPQLSAGEEAQALVTFEITKRDIVAPESTEQLRVPKRSLGS